MSREQILLLGEDHPKLDAYEVLHQAQGRSACSLCAGSSVAPIKDLGPLQNEDALLVIDEGPRTLLAVADAHFGSQASRALIERLAAAPGNLFTGPLALLEFLPSLADALESDEYNSESTLLVAVVDREKGTGFGISMGDSSLVVLGLDRSPRLVNRKNQSYVRPNVPNSLDPRNATDFSFDVSPGGLVLAFTDGVDECHYRSPKTSVQSKDLESTHIRTGGDPGKFVHELTKLALAGVGGNPGGQDNIALIATRFPSSSASRF